MENITYKLKINSEQILYSPNFDELIETIKDISSKQNKGYIFVYQKINDDEWRYICKIEFKRSKYKIVPAWIGVLEDIAERLGSKQKMNLKIYSNEVMKTDKKQQTSIKDDTIQLWQEYKEKGEVYNFIIKLQNELDFAKGILTDDGAKNSVGAVYQARQVINHITEGICEAIICDYNRIHDIIKDIDTISDCDDLSIVREILIKMKGKLIGIQTHINEYQFFKGKK